MKEFLTESVAPFAGVCAAIGGLTLALFDVPAQPPPVSLPQATPVTAQPAPPAGGEARDPGKDYVTRDQLDATLAKALRTLDASRKTTMGLAPKPAPTAASAPLAAPTAPGPVALGGAQVPPQGGVPSVGQTVGGPAMEGSKLETGPAPEQLLSTVSSLGEAIKSIRNARTEEDFVAAEQQVRAAREQMERLCGPGGGPMCDSANQIRSMGF